ncbi:MAG TPA: S4 domain-containing protein, partial [bacterium]|nr:S4 domain-containing protein [bacterium]
MKMTDDMPLVRFLAAAGFGSRRHCDALIEGGHVTVNDIVARPGSRVCPGRDHVKVDGEAAVEPPVYIYILLNKPKG